MKPQNISIVEMNLSEALEKYPKLEGFTLQYSATIDDADGSTMSDLICDGNEKFYRNTLVGICFVENKIAGWAWIKSYKECDDKWSCPPRIGTNVLGFMIYVKPYFRRMGVGSKLFNWGQEVRRRRKKKLVVYPWDDKSHNFYAKMPNKHIRSVFDTALLSKD